MAPTHAAGRCVCVCVCACVRACVRVWADVRRRAQTSERACQRASRRALWSCAASPKPKRVGGGAGRENAPTAARSAGAWPSRGQQRSADFRRPQSRVRAPLRAPRVARHNGGRRLHHHARGRRHLCASPVARVTGGGQMRVISELAQRPAGRSDKRASLRAAFAQSAERVLAGERRMI